MTDERSFRKLVAGVQAGDQEAANLLVERYWPQVLRIIRVRLRDRRLRQRLDSIDICQSVFSNLFCQLASGEFQPDSPEKLLRFLAETARNRFVDQVRRHRAARRDIRRTDPVHSGDLRIASVGDKTPSQILAVRECAEQCRGRLGDDEWWLLEQRSSGRSWKDIAHELGTGAEAVRKRHDRALERVRNELGPINE
jgi:RNA polymerase sigma factor (sigma-70 family)